MKPDTSKAKNRSKARKPRSLSVAGGSALSLFDGLPDRVRAHRIPGGILFAWTRKGVGFGELTMRVTRGKLVVDTECMGPDFCSGVVRQAISEALPNPKFSDGKAVR